jgi:hypothetical protein
LPHEGLKLRQFDIKTAILNGYLKDEVYIRPPHGWKYLAGPGRVLRLDCALYGVWQASTAWNKRHESELTALGLVQSDVDPALWILHRGGHVPTVFCVDDGVVPTRTPAEADTLVDRVAGIFSVRKLGEPQGMLGIEISRDPDAGTITIRQAGKAQSLATAFGVEGESCATPMTPVEYEELQAAREGNDMAGKEAYQSGIGCILLGPECGTPCGDARCHPLRRLHFLVESPTATQVCPWRCDVVRCEFCIMSRYAAQDA